MKQAEKSIKKPKQLMNGQVRAMKVRRYSPALKLLSKEVIWPNIAGALVAMMCSWLWGIMAQSYSVLTGLKACLQPTRMGISILPALCWAVTL